MDEFENLKTSLAKLFEEDYVTHEQLRIVFEAVQAAIDTHSQSGYQNLNSVIEQFNNNFSTFESQFRARLGQTNASVGTKASKEELQSVSQNIKTLSRRVADSIEDVRSEIPRDVLSYEQVRDRIIKERKLIPVEVISGIDNFIDKKKFEEAIIEIGGKLTVLEKRKPKGYGALGGGSEGTGSLFISRLRDVDLTGLQKNYEGKYILGSGAGVSQPVYTETPQGAIDGNNTVYYMDHTIGTILSFAINGQFIHPYQYTYYDNIIEFNEPLDETLEGKPFTLVYFGGQTAPIPPTDEYALLDEMGNTLLDESGGTLEEEH